MKAVIFDLFETLVTEWGYEKYTKRKTAVDLGVDEELFSKEWEQLHKDMHIGKYSDFTSALSYVVNKMNVEVKPELLKTATQKRISTKETIFNKINLNIINMLRELKNEGYKLGLISNCDSNEITVFRSCELYNLFDAVVLSCDERLLKPDKEIYCLCVERLKVLPGDCLYIGDGGSNELDGAINAGMKTAQAVWFIKVFRDNYINSEGYDVLQSPEEVLKYLKMIWN